MLPPPLCGTSLARKRGIEEAQGKYILFVDVDDRYRDDDAIEKMHRAIVEDDCQIVQFGHYCSHIPGMLTSKFLCSEKRIYTRKELLKGKIFDASIGRGGTFDGNLWAKIFLAETLKNAVKDIHDSLCQQEDLYQNLFTFTDATVRKVSVRREAYYVYNVGIGVSNGENTQQIMLRNYNIYKTDALRLLNQMREEIEKELHDYMTLRVYSESLWCYRSTVNNMIYSRKADNEILSLIREVEEYPYIQQSKLYFRAHSGDTDRTALDFMCSDYTPEEYLSWCKTNLPDLSMKQRLVRTLKKIVYASKKWL